ncbi:hypothetical protein C5167_035386 [Papaver somniferum]|uniref:Dihydroxy-acid/6-phosphogluconate dehydratase N-terminal domain-containing protein n=1 Tax=Papaver somniferum TaxID=3469 RepID=A0A4Y7KIJ8_PAPSO|nr:hypothetical protein C5167_035386 [Papaver somniferum]
MDWRPRDIFAKKSVHNATAVVMALGRSTNDVLHLIVIPSNKSIGQPNHGDCAHMDLVPTSSTESLCSKITGKEGYVSQEKSSSSGAGKDTNKCHNGNRSWEGDKEKLEKRNHT